MEFLSKKSYYLSILNGNLLVYYGNLLLNDPLNGNSNTLLTMGHLTGSRVRSVCCYENIKA